MLQARRVEAAVVDPRTLLEMSLSEEHQLRPSTGMIPSQQLEEKRKAFVCPEFDYTQKSRAYSDRSYIYHRPFHYPRPRPIISLAIPPWVATMNTRGGQDHSQY